MYARSKTGDRFDPSAKKLHNISVLFNINELEALNMLKSLVYLLGLWKNKHSKIGVFH